MMEQAVIFGCIHIGSDADIELFLVDSFRTYRGQ